MKGIYIDPAKLNPSARKMNRLYLYTSHDCNSFNLFSLINDNNISQKAMAEKSKFGINTIIEKLPLINMSQNKDNTQNVTDPGIAVLPYLYLENKPQLQSKREAAIKCSMYRLERNPNHKDWWLIQYKPDNQRDYINLEPNQQNYTELIEILKLIKNPKLDYVRTLDDDLIIVIDKSGNLQKRLTKVPENPSIGNFVALNGASSGYIIEKEIFPWPTDANHRPKNPRKWIEGALFNEADNVYLKQWIDEPNPDYFLDENLKKSLEKKIKEAKNDEVQKAFQEELESRQIEVKTKQKENPYTLYLWNPVTEVKSTKQSAGSKKLVRKHKGIHQIGGKAGKLKKGYKYSGKTLKNGKPQIIKVKRN
jgi:hypothetical protein